MSEWAKGRDGEGAKWPRGDAPTARDPDRNCLDNPLIKSFKFELSALRWRSDNAHPRPRQSPSRPFALSFFMLAVALRKTSTLQTKDGGDPGRGRSRASYKELGFD